MSLSDLLFVVLIAAILMDIVHTTIKHKQSMKGLDDLRDALQAVVEKSNDEDMSLEEYVEFRDGRDE